MSEYPDNWDDIAYAAKQAAGWRCEHCGAEHDPVFGYCLTVHHLDRDPANCDLANLVALCQRCHLHWQARFVLKDGPACGGKAVPGQTMMGFALPGWLEKRLHGG